MSQNLSADRTVARTRDRRVGLRALSQPTADPFSELPNVGEAQTHAFGISFVPATEPLDAGSPRAVPRPRESIRDDARRNHRKWRQQVRESNSYRAACLMRNRRVHTGRFRNLRRRPVPRRSGAMVRSLHTLALSEARLQQRVSGTTNTATIGASGKYENNPVCRISPEPAR